MPDRVQRYSIRLEVKDGGRASAELIKIGKDGSQSFRKVDIAAESTNRNLQQLGRTITSFKWSLYAAGAASVATVMHQVVVRAAEAEELMGKVNVVFGEQAETVKDWARALGEEVGRSSFDLLEYASRFQDTFVPLGYARDDAAELSKRLVQLTLDLAAFNNEAEAETAQLLASALVGNHEAVRRYGIVIEQSRLEQELLNMGIEGGAKAASSLEKVQARLNLVFNDSADAMGTAARESEGFMGRLRDVGGLFKDVAIQAGKLLMPIGKLYLAVAKFGLSNTKKVLEGIAEGFAYVRDAITPVRDMDLGQLNRQLEVTQGKIKRIRDEYAGHPGQGRKEMMPGDQAALDRLIKYEQQLLGLIRQINKVYDGAGLGGDKGGKAKTKIEQTFEAMVSGALSAEMAVEKLTVSEEAGVDAVDELIQKMREEVALLRLGTKERAALKAIYDAQNAAMKEGRLLTAEEIAQIRDLVNAKTDLTDAEKKSTEAREKAAQKLEKMKSDAEALKRQYDATFAFDEAVAELDKLRSAGLITAEVHAMAFADAERVKLQASREWKDGAIRGLQDYADAATDAAANTERVFANALDGLEDLLVGASTAKDALRSLVEDVNRLFVRQTVTGPLAKGLAGAFQSFSLFHEGGVVGEGGRAGVAPASVFAGARRYHAGGGPGLTTSFRHDEVPAVLQLGEEVLTASDPRHRNNIGGFGGVSIGSIDLSGSNLSRAEVQGAIAQAMRETLGVSQVQIQQFREAQLRDPSARL